MAEQGQRILVDKGRVDALRMSGEFDAQWYLQEYPDVALLDMDPAEHFVWIGQKMGRAGRGQRLTKQAWWRRRIFRQGPYRNMCCQPWEEECASA